MYLCWLATTYVGWKRPFPRFFQIFDFLCFNKIPSRKNRDYEKHFSIFPQIFQISIIFSRISCFLRIGTMIGTKFSNLRYPRPGKNRFPKKGEKSRFRKQRMLINIAPLPPLGNDEGKSGERASRIRNSRAIIRAGRGRVPGIASQWKLQPAEHRARPTGAELGRNIPFTRTQG